MSPFFDTEEPSCWCHWVDIGVGRQRAAENPECPVHTEPAPTPDACAYCRADLTGRSRYTLSGRHVCADVIACTGRVQSVYDSAETRARELAEAHALIDQLMGDRYAAPAPARP